MSYELIFIDADGEDIDGDHLATGRGWYEASEWMCEQLGAEADGPLADLCEDGKVVEDLEELQKEIGNILESAEPTAPVAGTLRHLLDLLKERPEEAVGVVVTDGVE